ncbi:MAG TPA: hypothetical protein VF540_03350 [Segetibacter sp.]
MSYNIFNAVHRPLKLALLTTCINMSKKNRYSIPEAEKSLSKVTEVLRIFKEQIELENDVILPLIFEYEPSVCNNYLSQHYEQMEQLQKLESLIHSFGRVKDEIAQFELMILINEAFNKFLLSNYHHMDDEEEILNNILWQYYSDDFLAGLLHRDQYKSAYQGYQPEGAILHSATAA